MTPPRRFSGKDGFTLIEVLVAFTVLALLTVVVQRGVMTAAGGAARADARIGAELVARTLMTAPLVTGPDAARAQSGTMNGYDWTLHFEPLDLPFASSVAADGSVPQWTPLRMVARVSGGKAGGDVTIETVRLVKTAGP